MNRNSSLPRNTKSHDCYNKSKAYDKDPRFLRIQAIRASRSSQYQNNPFRKDYHSNKGNKMQCPLEFFNYKSIQYQEPIDDDSDLRLIQHPTSTHIKRSQIVNRLSTKDQDDMIMEIKLQLLLTSSINRQLLIIATLFPTTDKEVCIRRINIPLNPQYKNTLFIDIDETIMHTFPLLDYQSDSTKMMGVNLCYKINAYQVVRLTIVVRPFLLVFLKAVAELFNIVVYK